MPELADNYEGMEQKGLKMEFFAKTDQGKMRKMNQDFLFATGDALGKFPNLFLLADGMGGHRAGDFASRYLVESLTTLLKQSFPKQYPFTGDGKYLGYRLCRGKQHCFLQRWRQ